MPADEREVLNALETSQRSELLRQPLPRRRLTPATVALLWLLRVYVVAAVAVVVVTFVRATVR